MVEFEKMLESMQEKVEDNSNRIKRIEDLLADSQKIKKEKKLSIKEFILSKNVKEYTKKTLIVGYYLENYDKISPFSTKDLIEGFKQAKESRSKNISDDVYQCVKKGWMMETRTKSDKIKSYTLTNTGEEIVENNFKRKSD